MAMMMHFEHNLKEPQRRSGSPGYFAVDSATDEHVRASVSEDLDPKLAMLETLVKSCLQLLLNTVDRAMSYQCSMFDHGCFHPPLLNAQSAGPDAGFYACKSYPTKLDLISTWAAQ